MRIKETLYFDHQATTPVDAWVLDQMIPFFTQEFANPHSADHYRGWVAAKAVEEAAERIASLIGADADEIVFTSGATEANNLVLQGLAKRSVDDNRRRILVSAIEHKCVLAASRILEEQHGYTVQYLPVDGEGFIDIPSLEEAIGDDVLLVSIMTVNNEIGTIQEIREVSRIVHAHGALFHSDAAQAPGAVDLVEMADLVDFVSLSAHKMYGPKGIGALFVRRDMQNRLEPLFYGGGQQQGLRSGTVPTALCVGMGAAAAKLELPDYKDERETIRRRRDYFVECLQRLPWGVSVNGPKAGARHPGNANVCFRGFSAHDILSSLQPRLAASTGSACTSGIPEPSHVLKAIKLSTEEAEASIRFSLGRSTTDADVDEAVALVAEALAKLDKAHLSQAG